MAAEVLLENLLRTTDLGFFPNDIMVDILSRLPVKSLVRFKNACKSWCALLGNGKFAKLHLDKAKASDRECLLMRLLKKIDEQMYSSSDEESVGEEDEESADGKAEEEEIEISTQRVEMVSFSSFRDINLEDGSMADPKKFLFMFDKSDMRELSRLEVPVQNPKHRYVVVGSCNGLVCLTESTYTERFFPSLNFYMWNPATREIRRLPPFHIGKFGSISSAAAVGFTFNSFFDDFKVVRIAYNYYDNIYIIESCLLKTGYWKRMNAKLEGHVYNRPSQASVNGALHWLAYKSDGNQMHHVVIAFDTLTDNLVEIELPRSSCNYRYLLHESSAAQESLGLLVYNKAICEIWRMEEYGVAWCKHYSIQLDGGLRRPIFVVNDFKILMLEAITRRMVFRHRTSLVTASINMFHPIHVFKHIESLVSPYPRNDRSHRVKRTPVHVVPPSLKLKRARKE